MENRFTDLRCKEIINVSDGARLGFASDVIVEIPGGQVCAIVVPGPCRFWGLFGREYDYVFPWCAVRRIGEDIILVDIDPAVCRNRREKKRKFL